MMMKIDEKGLILFLVFVIVCKKCVKTDRAAVALRNW